jgi:hypothetical protein
MMPFNAAINSVTNVAHKATFWPVLSCRILSAIVVFLNLIYGRNGTGRNAYTAVGALLWQDQRFFISHFNGVLGTDSNALLAARTSILIDNWLLRWNGRLSGSVDTRKVKLSRHG